MKTSRFWKRSVAFLVSAILTCGGWAAHAARSFDQLPIDETPWSVAYVGSDYDAGSNTTTFSYQVTVSRSPDLSHWVVELPPCAEFVSASPSEPVVVSTNPDPTTGVVGLKWDGGQSLGTQTYSLRLRGYVSEGDVQFSVKGATIYAVGTIKGPANCGAPPASTFSISGSVFVDVDGDGTLDHGEPRLGNVTVNLLDATGQVVGSIVSGPDGSYTFSGLAAGTYSVRIPDSTPAPDFNETLDAYFWATTSPTQQMNLQQNVSSVNFGYFLNAAGVLADLDRSDPDKDGFTFIGSGKTIGFWKHQLQCVLKGKGKPQVSEPLMVEYLAKIEALFLPEPFKRVPGRVRHPLQYVQPTGRALEEAAPRYGVQRGVRQDAVRLGTGSATGHHRLGRVPGGPRVQLQRLRAADREGYL